MKRSLLSFIAIAALLVPVARAADSDVTGLVPTIWWDFETQPTAAGLATANKGSASISFTSEGTVAYAAGATNGWALNTASFTPYSGAGTFSTAGNSFTISAVMNLGTNPNGITLNVRTSAGDLVIRRGDTAGSLVVGFGPQKAASTHFLNATFGDGDAAYHLVTIVAERSSMKLYVDGAFVEMTTEFSIWSASGYASQMQFGSHLNGAKAGEAKNGGCIDDLRIHNAALTPSQMTAIATECGLSLNGFVSVRAMGEPTVGKNSFSMSWSLAIGPDDVAYAAIVYGTDSALSSPTTNVLGSALSTGGYTAPLTGLFPSTTYWWKVVASNGIEWAETDIASFRTLDEIASPAFSWRMPITVSGYAGASTLTNFPVLVALAAGSPPGFDPADCAAGGSDLRFADADGTVLAHEFESWNPSGTSYIWVRVPRLAGTTTQLSLYYGADPAELPAVAASDVWSRYAAVVHGGSGLSDSSPNALAVANGGGVAALADAGIVGGGIKKSVNKSIGLNVANPSASLSNSGQFSVSAWFKRDGNGGKSNGTHILAANRSGWSSEDGFAILQETGTHISVSYKGGHNWSTGSGALTNQTWGHIAFAYDKPGAMLAAYFNGSPYQTKSNPTTLVNTSCAYWTFGSFANASTDDSFKGDMDEIRVFDGVASADWIKAEYDSVADPAAFAVVGAPQPANPDAPRFSSTFATVSRSDATFSVTLSNVSAETAVSVFYGTDGSTFTELPLGTLSAAGTLSATALGLDVGTYGWYARATATVVGVPYAPVSGRNDFAITYAKDPTASYKHFTATLSYAGTSAAEYAAMADANAVSYGAVVSVDMGDPRISAPVVARLSDGTFRVTAEISQNEPKAGSVKCVVGGVEFAMTTADSSLPATYSVVLSGLAAGTYTATVQAESAGGTVVSRSSVTVFHAGALVVSKVADADETTLSPGAFRISRADADPTDLPAISFDVAFSGPGLAAVVVPTVTTLTIPASTASVDISIQPVYTTAVDADATLTLTASGAFIGTPSSGSINILNAIYDPAVRYVATTGDDENHGGTPDLPKKTIGGAVSSLAAIAPMCPCTVHVAPGLYRNSSPIVLTNAIHVLGDDPDPSRTIVSNIGQVGFYGSHNQRLFTLNHADALVANLTMQKGFSSRLTRWGIFR